MRGSEEGQIGQLGVGGGRLGVPAPLPREDEGEAQPADGVATGRAGALAWVLFGAAILLYLGVSDSLLTALGIPYSRKGGSPLVKIHPGTYLLALSFAITFGLQGNPLRVLGTAALRARGLALYAVLVASLFVSTAIRFGETGGFSFYLDSLLAPALCGLVLAAAPPAVRRRLFAVVTSVLVLNAAIAIAEFLTHRRLIPFSISGRPETAQAMFRASALLGHPLNNAMVTAPALIVVLGAPVSARLRGGAALILGLGLLAFGGRTGVVVTGAAVVVVLARAAVARVVRRQLAYRQVVATAIVAILGLGALAMLVAGSGIATRVLTKMEWDSSAAARVVAWQALDYVNGWDFVFGIPPGRVDQLANHLGLIAIENFWLAMLLQLGVCGFIPLVVAFAALAAHLWRRAHGTSRLAMLAFFTIASANNSFSAKSATLTLAVVLILCAASVGRDQADADLTFDRATSS